MSGHSHYATIKRQKEGRDAAKGKIFSKLARGIQIGGKAGGGPDPNANYKLRMVVDAARSANMPKDNIERAISKASLSDENIEEVVYEGFGPSGVGVIVETATDNRNRTGQEIKNIFERGGGSMAGPGSVAFNFEPKGLILLKKANKVEEQMLKLIDVGVDDIQETDDALEVYVSPDKLSEIRTKLIDQGYDITTSEIIRRAKNFQIVEDPSAAKKVLDFLEVLEEQDDVQKVFANVDIPDNVLLEANK